MEATRILVVATLITTCVAAATLDDHVYQSEEQPPRLVHLFEENEIHQAKKRLPVFLRTGRDSMSEDGDLGRTSMQKGLWFGPRLGRVQKRDPVGFEDRWGYVIFPGNAVTRQVHYTPRLGRESEELIEA